VSGDDLLVAWSKMCFLSLFQQLQQEVDTSEACDCDDRSDAEKAFDQERKLGQLPLDRASG
jgi:hypothetical protein